MLLELCEIFFRGEVENASHGNDIDLIGVFDLQIETLVKKPGTA